MTKKTQITPLGIFLRYLLAAVVVFATYNPTGYSWVDWARVEWVSEDGSLALLAFTAVVLLIGWAICLRATVRSLGAIGTILALAFFGILLWLLIDSGLVGIDQLVVLTWLVEIVIIGVLGTGICWSHIRRRLTGQLDVDDTEA